MTIIVGEIWFPESWYFPDANLGGRMSPYQRFCLGKRIRPRSRLWDHGTATRKKEKNRTILTNLVTLTIAMIFLITLVLFPYAANATATIRYVAPTGSDTGDCTSFLAPCRTIQYAVNQSNSGDQVLVAQGTYTYAAALDPCPFLRTRAVVCFVDKQLAILGGYTTNDWLESNPDTNLTIIDGQNAHRGVAVIGYQTETTHLEMAGFTIQNGLAQGPTSYDSSGIGGGMLVQHAAITLRDMIFRDNVAIGQNTDSGYGGQANGAALRIEESPVGTTSLLQRIVFDGNQSYGGTGPERGGVAFGALFIYKSAVTVEDSVFTNNLARGGDTTGSGLSGGLHADALGGGVGIEQGIINLRRVTVTGNQVRGGDATTYGGGAYGGGVFIEDFGGNETIVTISDSYVTDNMAVAGHAAQGGHSAGGGICSANSNQLTIERTSIISNESIGGASTAGDAGPGAGGGLYTFADREGNFYTRIENTIIAENFADQGDGGTSPGNGGGGGIVIHGVKADITHATLARNSLGATLILGQGLLVQSWPSPSNPILTATVTLNHSIIADHVEGGESATAIVVQRESSLTFDGGMFSGNNQDTNVNDFPVPAGTINGLSGTFSAPTAGFAAPGPPDHDYHLSTDSPALDQAIGSALPDDIDGQRRPYGDAADVGADEYVPPALTVTPQVLGTLVTSRTNTVRSVLVDVQYTTRVINWEATTTAPWLSLSLSDSGDWGNQAFGQSGERLYLAFDPTDLNPGVYETDVPITSQEASPTTLHVRMVNAEQIFTANLPLILR